MARIAFIVTGYVGLVTGAMLSDFGHTVVCMDTNSVKINELKKNIIPIFEDGLTAVVERNSAYGRLSFTCDIDEAVRNSEVVFIAVGTPPDEDGSADMQYVLSAAKSIAHAMNGYKVIVDKSTVPVGTARRVSKLIREELNILGKSYDFDVVSNPEFLREGSAVYDFTHPDRIVLGAESAKALEIMKEVYRVLYINDTPFVETNFETAEMTKYACNAFLAVKITFINEIANLCDAVGADVKKISKAMGLDGRISPKFLHAGPGYGGSCFPKDTKALYQTSKEFNVEATLIGTTIEANEKQKLKMVEKIRNQIGDLSGITFSVLGVTFKPNTDDCRDAPSLIILPELVKLGAKLRIFDPQGKRESERLLADISSNIVWCENEYDTFVGATSTILMTEWNVFRNLDFTKMNTIETFFDLRNVYSRTTVESHGIKYVGVGV